MRRAAQTHPLCACLVLGALLAGALLAGCHAAGSVAADDDQDAAVEQTISDQDDVGDTGAGASGTVEVGAFTFDIPAYWEGRVEVEVSSGQAGYPQAVVHLPGQPAAELATLKLVDGDEVFSMGDIASHVAGVISSGNGTHVEVWTTNWPWLVANEQARHSSFGLGLDDETLAQLVDLSTGGELSYDELAVLDIDDVDMVEFTYTEAELASTVAFG